MKKKYIEWIVDMFTHQEIISERVGVSNVVAKITLQKIGNVVMSRRRSDVLLRSL